jgi:hypothetical protein
MKRSGNHYFDNKLFVFDNKTLNFDNKLKEFDNKRVRGWPQVIVFA